jgi:DtxR family Mn-dependent transcriptional regulator
MAVKSHRTPESEAVDDYLKAILALNGPEDEPVRSNDLAAHLGIRAASVTEMLQKLSARKPLLVEYQKHRGVRLTAAGRRRAWELVRHHRLIELFLHDVLKYPWDEVHEEAERLEHFISEKFEERVAAILGDPEFDPHGHVIPKRNGTIPSRPETLLTEWPAQAPGRVSSVKDTDAAALRQLEKIGLVPNAAVIVQRRESNGSLWIGIGGSRYPVRLSQALAERVAVHS